jgi:4-amino-4-deoxy-L-arabinose transferase-like glycosyltransferase
MIMRQTFTWIFLIVLAAATFLPFIEMRDIAASHEARVVLVARAMADAGWPWNAKKIDVPQVQVIQTLHGERLASVTDGSTMAVNPWIVPVINGDIRLQKPPLPYWCAAILFRLIGFGDGGVSSRMVPALLGAFSVLIIWDFARLLLGRIGAWYAAIVWVSSFFIVDQFRKTLADPYLAFFTLAATWTWIRAVNSRRSDGWLIACYAMLALGTLAKGPIIFLFVPITLVVYHICYRKRPPTSRNAHIIGVIVFLLIGLPWYFIVWKTVPHALELWRYESIGEVSDNNEKARMWWYYLPNLLLITLPWTPIWLMGLAFPLRFRSRRRFFPLVATVLIVLIFSISYVKKNAYLLPLMPIETLVIAQGLIWITAIFRPSPRHRPVHVPMLRATLLAFGFAVAVQIVESGVMTIYDNDRSARYASGFAMEMLNRSPHTSLLVSHVPEEAMVYLPANLSFSPDSDSALLIADDRLHEADSTARQIKILPAGSVGSIESIGIGNAHGTRWKIFKLTIAPPVLTPVAPASEPTPPLPPSSGPSSSQSDTPAPSTSSSGSPASRESF